MTIFYNGLTDVNNMLCFTDIPNILKVKERIAGQKASFSFNFYGNLKATVTADSQYYVTFLGETVTSVMNASEAKNKRFYVDTNPDNTAASFARAMRNCSGINAEFNVIHIGNSVTLYAKTLGQKWSNIPNYITRNIPNEYLLAAGVDGQAWSYFFNGKVGVDVYSGTTDLQNYVTTLEKNYYGDECAFDMSPVLAALSEYGKTVPYRFVMSLTDYNGTWSELGSVNGMSTVGYMANQSNKYLWTNDLKILINTSRGDDGMILYTYANEIPFSVLCGGNNTAFTVSVSCKNSANEEIHSATTTVAKATDNLIVDTSITVEDEYFTNSYYIDVTVGSETVRFNVIKPLKATEYYQRVLWRNEYGGISFFDFTGQMTDSDSIDIETYEKNIFDFYDVNYFEKKMTYKSDYNKQVTLTSHLIENDGKYIFNSLIRSKKMWTTVNSKTYYIIPVNLEVNEDGNYNGIYEAKFTYEYSDL